MKDINEKRVKIASHYSIQRKINGQDYDEFGFFAKEDAESLVERLNKTNVDEEFSLVEKPTYYDPNTGIDWGFWFKVIMFTLLFLGMFSLAIVGICLLVMTS